MSKRTRLVAAVGVCGLACGVASAQTWNLDNNGNWNVAANWLPAAVPNGAAAAAVMGNVITAERTVTLNLNPQLNSLSFSTQNNNARYIIAGNQALLFRGNANAIDLANNNRGDHEITSGIDIATSDLTITNANAARGSLAIFGPMTQANNVARKVFVKGGGRIGFFGKVAATGGIEIDGGLLSFFRNENLGGGNAGISMKNNATLTLFKDASLPVQPANITVNRAIAMANSPTFVQDLAGGAPDLILGGVLSGVADPVFFGNISLTNNNTFTGKVVAGAGTLGIGSDQSLGNAANSIDLSFSVVRALNNFNSARAIELRSNVGFDTNGKNVTLSGVISNVLPNGVTGLGKLGAGTLTLSGNNTFVGDVDILDGTLSISKAANLGAPTIVQLSGGTLLATDSLALAAEFRLPVGNSSIDVAAGKTLSLGKLSGGPPISTGVLNKIGAGNLEISDNAGKKIKRVNVNAGTLGLGGGGVLDTNDGLFVDNAKIKGTGKVTGPVQFTSKAKVKPGNSPGTLTFEGPTLFVGSNTFEIDINSAVGAAGGTIGWGLLNVTETLTLTALPSDPMVVELVSLSTSNLNSPLADFDASQFYSWTFAVAAGGIVGFDPSAWAVDVSDFRNSLQGGSFAVVQFGNELRLQFTPIPAPGALAVLGLAALARRRRR